MAYSDKNYDGEKVLTSLNDWIEQQGGLIYSSDLTMERLNSEAKMVSQVISFMDDVCHYLIEHKSNSNVQGLKAMISETLGVDISDKNTELNTHISKIINQTKIASEARFGGGQFDIWDKVCQVTKSIFKGLFGKTREEKITDIMKSEDALKLKHELNTSFNPSESPDSKSNI